eukprot:jgi/Chrpa1/1412/Chrysochromulina_OHIO_Genome00003875-RA
MPYCQATFEDWRRVAAQVHWETITAAVRPVLTSRPPVLKNSEFVTSDPPNLCSRYVRNIVPKVKAIPKPKSMP